jgi:glycosyltransferase involved in cell wall biosynthesis
MPRLSAVIITRNEEVDLGPCLDAVAFCDERVVVDSGSTDRTVEVARGRGARVVEHAFEGFGPQKRFAVSQAAHDWVLCLDADERPDGELAGAIRALLVSGEPPLPAYRLRFATVFMGRVFTRGAMARETHLRLFDRRRAGWDDASVHEQVVTTAPVGQLPGQVRHETVKSLSEALLKMDGYTTRGALELHRRGVQRGALAILLTGPTHFVRSWLVHGNVLNGLPGLAWALLAAVSATVKYLKLAELRGGR